MENLDICNLAIRHTIDTARGGYLDIIDNKRDLALICLESMAKMRHYLDGHPTFFQKIEEESLKEEEEMEVGRFHHALCL